MTLSAEPAPHLQSSARSACEGSCLCGAVRYRLSGDPLTVYACHCTDCQRRTGTAFALSMVVVREAVELIQGDPAAYFATLADGRTKHGRMCSLCGTRLWGEPLRNKAILVIQPGNLDQASEFQPVAHQWTRSALAWIVFPPGVTLYPTQPDDPKELIRLWRGRLLFGEALSDRKP